MVFVVLIITNLGLGPNIETTSVVCVTDSFQRAEQERDRAASALKGEGRRFVIQPEPLVK